ncbi:hypothetical protein RHAL1_03137 [Beijerinckiaceae bacterium RH AL1]|nr:hypothetical protein RHAL1_03137 [Beijerinckiaceae bacterium RH AL1]
MKFASRTQTMPIGTVTETASVTLRTETLLRQAKAVIATIAPISPPWNDMPPFHTVTISSGCWR